MVLTDRGPKNLAEHLSVYLRKRTFSLQCADKRV